MAYVNRAFYKIVEGARLSQLAEFFFYFKQTFIGLTDQEFRMKAAAFGSNFGQNLIYSAPEEEQVYEGFLNKIWGKFNKYFLYRNNCRLSRLYSTAYTL